MGFIMLHAQTVIILIADHSGKKLNTLKKHMAYVEKIQWPGKVILYRRVCVFVLYSDGLDLIVFIVQINSLCSYICWVITGLSIIIQD